MSGSVASCEIRGANNPESVRERGPKSVKAPLKGVAEAKAYLGWHPDISARRELYRPRQCERELYPLGRGMEENGASLAACPVVMPHWRRLAPSPGADHFIGMRGNP